VRLILAVLAFAMISDALLDEPTATQVEFCQLPVPERLREGRASFSVVYAFRVRQGRPVDVREVANPAGVPGPAVTACIERWRFGRASYGDLEIRAEFRWTHGVGWEHLRLKSADIDLRVSITGDRCAYR
jgi:hypothetical protein